MDVNGATAVPHAVGSTAPSPDGRYPRAQGVSTVSTLMQASNEWSNRPADQRYSSLNDLHAACVHFHDIARTATRPYKGLQIVMGHNGVQAVPMLQGERGAAGFTHWSFGQLAARVGAPAHYLRTLPAANAVADMNHGLQSYRHSVIPTDDDANASLLFTQNGGLTLQAATSTKYTRIWNDDITRRLLRLPREWQPAPAAFDGSRGLYASDHDLFAFMVDNDRRIFERDANGGLGRGFFVTNSMVGAASFAVTTFMFEYVCGNHRVWGASGVQELRIRHIGNADERAFAELSVELTRYADASAADDEAKVSVMRRTLLGATKDEVLDKVFGLRIPDLSRRLIGEAYDKAVERVDWYGAPNSVWGLTGGLTEIARDLPHADERVKLDRAAGKVMAITF